MYNQNHWDYVHVLPQNVIGGVAVASGCGDDDDCGGYEGCRWYYVGLVVAVAVAATDYYDGGCVGHLTSVLNYTAALNSDTNSIVNNVD